MIARSPDSGELASGTTRARVVAPAGELDIFTSAGVRRALAAHDGDCEVVVLDLRKLSFLDASCIGLVVEAMHDLTGRGVRFAIVRGSASVQRPFALARLEDRLPFFDDLQSALDAG